MSNNLVFLFALNFGPQENILGSFYPGFVRIHTHFSHNESEQRREPLMPGTGDRVRAKSIKCQSYNHCCYLQTNPYPVYVGQLEAHAQTFVFTSLFAACVRRRVSSRHQCDVTHPFAPMKATKEGKFRVMTNR